MVILRYTRCDKEFINSMPPKLLAELIILEDVIPDDLSSALSRNNEIYHEERRQFVYRNKNVHEKIHRIRSEKYQLGIDDYLNYETDENIEFIKKYPQFKPIIDHIELCDGDDENLSTIERIPIDQYLAEN